MATLNQFLASRGVGGAVEGHTGQCPPESQRIRQLAQSSNAKRLMEIGFNAGHSAHALLNACPEATLVSFDIGEHGYGRIGKEFIDATYPGRHTLVIGDSRETIPRSDEEKVDFLFIDGGHTVDVACADIKNCKRLCGPDTVVVIDDVVTNNKAWEAEWSRGPTAAWEAAQVFGLIKHEGHEEYGPGRGVSWGKYVYE